MYRELFRSIRIWEHLPLFRKCVYRKASFTFIVKSRVYIRLESHWRASRTADNAMSLIYLTFLIHPIREMKFRDFRSSERGCNTCVISAKKGGKKVCKFDRLNFLLLDLHSFFFMRKDNAGVIPCAVLWSFFWEVADRTNERSGPGATSSVACSIINSTIQNSHRHVLGN